MRGAMAVMGAMWLGVAVICLMAIDIGHVFWQQREVQKIADMAAMAGASANQVNCVQSIEAIARSNGFSAERGDVFVNPNDPNGEPLLGPALAKMCGNWDPRKSPTKAGSTADRPDQFFREAVEPFNAARVTVQRTVPYFFVFGGDESRQLRATATAARTLPLAVLNIRSTLGAVDSSRSPLLNALFGGLLGGSLNLDAVAWNGLVSSQINLLSYLDALAVTLNVRAGDYDQLLQTEADVGVLLGTAIEVLERGGGTGTAVVDAIAGLVALQAAVPPGTPLVKLADLLQVQSGTVARGLDVGLQALQLVQGLVQAANAENGVVAEIGSTALGLAAVKAHVAVIEPPQISAIGNPELIDSDPIRVRTAQVRALISVDVGSPLNGLVSGLNAAISMVLEPVTNLLNNLLSLDLIGTLNALSCVVYCTEERQFTDIQLVPSPFRVDVNVDVAAGRAQVADFDCSSDGRKALTVSTTTSAANVRVGWLGGTSAQAVEAVFSSPVTPAVEPVPLLDIGIMTVRRECALAIFCSTTWKKGSGWVSDKSDADRQAFAGGGLGLRTDMPIAASSASLEFSAPEAMGLPDLEADIATPYKALSSSDLLYGVSGALDGLDIHMYQPSVEGGLGGLLYGVGAVLDGVIDLLRSAISTVLSPLLDPLVNWLLAYLGIDLAKTEVGARMTCRANVELVY